MAYSIEIYQSNSYRIIYSFANNPRMWGHGQHLIYLTHSNLRMWLFNGFSHGWPLRFDDLRKRPKLVGGFLYFLNSIKRFVGIDSEPEMPIIFNSFVFLSKYFISSTSFPPFEKSITTYFNWLVHMMFWDSQYSILNERFLEVIEFATCLENRKR